ncbi:uncharacterized protein SOCE26_093570 [Sorangium cellulosum]|uniref:Secreted protein n=1 Tax=Sorangium cellulosum TaxID=56 RepID=A0A2L0F8I7_SORCE|nr:hypothetical protein [Sorangium cellulosum]AUX47832.1 uncharacterized protein SOCE26_093570 [Sorangium cellulosum]
MSLPRPLVRVAMAALAGLALAAAGVVAVAEPSDPPSRAGYAPDPAALPSARQWVFEVLHAKGRSSIVRVRPVSLGRPAATARVMGRFAIELYVGKELLDRIRFDVPLTGDAPEKPSGVLFRRPTFDEGVTSRLRVQMADNPRASWAKLVDRKTGVEERFVWPPEPDGRLVPLDAQRAAAVDGGAPADAGQLPQLPTDAGWVADAGRLPVDAGWSPDAGRLPVDAGWSPDAGRLPVDAGWSPDAGRLPVDAGELPVDAGSPPADGGRPRGR